VTLKKEYNKDEASKICLAIRKAGASCKVEKIEEVTLEIANEIRGDEVADTGYSSAESDVRTTERICPNCKATNGSNIKVCPVCGYSLERGERETPELRTEYEQDSFEYQPGRREVVQSAVMKFVSHNADYYRSQFSRFGSYTKPKFALSWHWPAFFVFFFWALYRKMWLWAGVYFAGGIWISGIVPPGIPHLIWVLGWPLVANYIYFRHCLRKVGDGESDISTTDGGVSKKAVWAGIGLMFAAWIYMFNQMLHNYQQLITAELDNVDIVRGDGSSLSEADTTDKKTLQTLTNMSLMMASVNLVAGSIESLGSDDALADLVKRLQQREIKDAWNTPLQISGEGKLITLRSAGTDKVFGTNDDIIQRSSLQSSDDGI
ncbi:MAG: DUF2628 domain-containing protein, partial [Pseudomonadota bacterium]